MMDNFQLSGNFSFFELTRTDNAALQKENRNVTDEQIVKLRALADHCEVMREICGGTPLRIHSGYRSLALNGTTAGSSQTSQHPRCEAVDFDVPGQTVEDSFTMLLTAARVGQFIFGQLIIEQAKNRFSKSIEKWVHCSRIGKLNPAHVGQVLRKKDGPDGKPLWDLLETLRFKDAA